MVDKTVNRLTIGSTLAVVTLLITTVYSSRRTEPLCDNKKVKRPHIDLNDLLNFYNGQKKMQMTTTTSTTTTTTTTTTPKVTSPPIEEETFPHGFFNVSAEDLSSEIIKGVDIIQPQCKDRENSMSAVLNGQRADNHEWPWAVFLYGRGFCTGTLITRRWVLTAAHCREAHIDTVILGTNNLVDTNNPLTQMRAIEKVVSHPKYDGVQTWTNDISLMKMSSSVVLSESVQIGCLTTEHRQPDFKNCFGVGWGYTDIRKKRPSLLLNEIATEVMDSITCMLALIATDTFVGIYDSHLCANFTEKNTGLCFGDSGGGVNCMSRDGNRFLITGIASYVFDDCNQIVGKPNILTKVTSVLPWILQTISQES